MLQAPRLLSKPATEGQLSWRKAVVIGFVQAIAIIPGVSRSGSTISAALLFGIDAATAARFSFLLSIPAILGASFVQLRDVEMVSLSPTAVASGVTTRHGISYAGTWEDIVQQMQWDDPLWLGESLTGYMEHVSRLSAAETGVVIPANDAEAFVLGSAAAGLLTIIG